MKLYHITMDLEHNGKFTARVPRNRLADEDSSTHRVCVSSILEGCFSAVPFGGLELKYTMEEVGAFAIFEIDTDELGIPDDNVVGPKSLYEKGLVADALLTDEHWILTDFFVPEEKRYIIELHDFTESSMDLASYAVLKLAEEKYKGDHNKAYTELYGSEAGRMLHVPLKIIITSLNYTKLEMWKGEVK